MNLLAFSSLFLAEDGVVLGLGIGLGIAVVVALIKGCGRKEIKKRCVDWRIFCGKLHQQKDHR